MDENNSSIDNKLKLLCDNFFGLLCIHDNQGKFLYANPAYCRHLGVDENTITQKTIYDILRISHPSGSSVVNVLKTKKKNLSVHQIALTGRKIISLSIPYFTPEGSLLYILSYSWHEDELYSLLQEFDQVRMRTKELFQFLQRTSQTETTFIVQSKLMKNLLEYTHRIASVDSTVLICGESGSGKEMFAKFIHDNSSRANEIFIPINCAALSPSLLESELFGYDRGAFTGGLKEGKAGLLEFADKGTIFLDELGEMPLDLQAKFLRVLENNEYKRLGGNKIYHCNVRFIAATNRDLSQMVSEKKFRSDLYYRLNVLSVNVPPLRNHPEDIVLLAQHFLNIYNKKYGFQKILSPMLTEEMINYSWPGNVRELKNFINRAVIVSPGKVISSMNFSNLEKILPHPDNINRVTGISTEQSYQTAMEEYERNYIEAMLQQCNGSIRSAAQKMKLHISTLYRKIEKLKIKIPSEKMSEDNI